MCVLFKTCIKNRDTMMHNSIQDEQLITECPPSLFSSAGKIIGSLGERREHRGLSARQQLPASGFWKVPSSSHTAWKTWNFNSFYTFWRHFEQKLHFQIRVAAVLTIPSSPRNQTRPWCCWCFSSSCRWSPSAPSWLWRRRRLLKHRQHRFVTFLLV